MHDQTQLAQQYQDDRNLKIRTETHQLYTVGANLEDEVDKALGLGKNQSLLDIGTGPGAFPGRLYGAGYTGRIVGVDLSGGMVAQASAKFPELEFVQADAMQLPFAAEAFDAVTARHMLYHVPDITQALREAKRVLQVGGRFLALTNVNGTMREFWQAVAEAVQDIPAFSVLLQDIRSAPYDHNHLLGLVLEAFGKAKLDIVDSALQFPNAEPVLRYFDSMQTMQNIPTVDWELGRHRLSEVLQHYSWPWRVTKGVALISAIKLA